MKLIEKDAKQLLVSQGMRIPDGRFFPWNTNAWPSDVPWSGPYYIKSQVLAGRRGKAGLVRRCESETDFVTILAELRLALSESTCDGFWCETECAHEAEWFVSCDIDPATGTMRAHVSAEGGKEVAMVQTFTAEEVLSSEMPSALQTFPKTIQTVCARLITMLPTIDALSIELNPCIIGAHEEVIALDAKIELDDAACIRHPVWKNFSRLSRFGAVTSPREQAYLDLLDQADRPLLGAYVELEGTIGMILAGGGASLVAMDALKAAGGTPANYLELSGNPDPAFLQAAARIVFSHPRIQVIWIAGSFANFTDIHATVQAILEAVEASGLRVPIVIRRDGPQADEAVEFARSWSDRTGIPLCFQRGDVDIATSAKTVVELLSPCV